MSMRSSSGPEIFETYRWIIGWVQWHSRVLSLKNPQGQGFMAAASMNRAGKVSDMAARAMRNVAIFERLAHDFKHVARKFRKLVEKQNTVMSE